MEIRDWQPAMAPDMTTLYNKLIQSVPHCPQLTPQDLMIGLASQSAPPAWPLTEQRILVGIDGGQVRGFIHIGMEAICHPKETRRGAIRFLAVLQDACHVGQALLDAAEQHLQRNGVREILAFHYDHRYPFYHVEHAYLSSRLEHLHKLLSANDYQKISTELVLELRDFNPHPAHPPYAACTAIEWQTNPGGSRELIALARDEQDEIGICISAPHRPDFDKRDWAYTRWLGVKDEHRGKGWGRYLLQTSLNALWGKGFRHASLCVSGDNRHAFRLYTRLGYQQIDRTHAYGKRTA